MVVTVQQLGEAMPDASWILSDEPEMESSQHLMQLLLLVSCLDWHWRDRDDYFIGANLTVYYSVEQLRSRDFRGPDFFLVTDTQKRPRASWVVWQEGGRYPDLIVELLSDSTADMDKGLKKELYQSVFRTPEYFWYSPITQEFAGFKLVEQEYEEIPATAEGWRWSKVLDLYLGMVDGKLRYIGKDGVVVPTPEEYAEEERQRADREHQRAEALAAKLRELGVDPDQLTG
jgi:Uma2 family endonuclease